LLDNGVEKYPVSNDSVFFNFPGMDHLYLRLAWSYLEPQEGEYDWHLIDEVVNKYVPEGYGISFRITTKETGTYPGSVGQEKEGVQYATPVWVEEAGARGNVAEAWGIQSWTPVWDDPVYLAKLAQFHQAFAARYDGRPWVRYVDIGSIGDWGEGHTSFSTRIPPTVEEVKANIDLYLDHYQSSQLVCTDDLLYYGKSDAGLRELYDYAIDRGITLRDDSPLVEWYLQQNLDTWSLSHPQFYAPLYLQKPIVFELQHYHLVKEDGNWKGKNGVETLEPYGYSGAEIMRRAIETTHATYIGYHGYAEDWLQENPELSNALANLCGYWYFPVAASFPFHFHYGNNPLSMTWMNRGVAPAYSDFPLVLRFEAGKASDSFEVTIDHSGNKYWLPGEEFQEGYQVQIPEGIQSGKYQLTFCLMDNSGGTMIPIQLGIQASILENDQFVPLGLVRIDAD